MNNSTQSTPPPTTTVRMKEINLAAHAIAKVASASDGSYQLTFDAAQSYLERQSAQLLAAQGEVERLRGAARNLEERWNAYFERGNPCGPIHQATIAFLRDVQAAPTADNRGGA